MSFLRWPLIVVLALTAGFLAPMLVDPSAITLNDDWTQILAFQGYLRDQLLEHGALPHRSHVLGGGFPLPGHPEYPVLSPLTLPVLLFGVTLGTKLAVVIVHLLGVAGMWGLCRRRLDLDLLPSGYAALVFAVGGWTPAILESGNYPQIHFMAFPLLLMLTLPRKGEERWFDGGVVLGAIVAGTMLLDGHLNAVACLILLAVTAASFGRVPALRAGLVLAGAAGLAAYKLGPTLALLAVSDRAVDAGAIEAVQTTWDHWLGLSGTADSYALGRVPWILAAGALGALYWTRRPEWHRILRPAGLLLLALWLWAGPTAPIDLFALLHKLPVMRSMDAPGKYFAFFVGFYGLLLGAEALQRLPASWPRWIAPLAIGAAALPLAVMGMRTLSGIFDEPDVPHRVRSLVQVDTDFFRGGTWTGPGARPDLYVWYRHGVGILRWEDNFQLPAPSKAAWQVNGDGTQSKSPAHPGEVWLEAGAGEAPSPAKLTHISANRMTASVTAKKGGWLVFNQRFDGGWSCGAREIRERGGLLGVRVGTQGGTVDCRYTSKPLVAGMLVSLLCAMLLGVGWWRARRRPAGSSDSPPAEEEDPAPGLSVAHRRAARILLAIGVVWVGAMVMLQSQRLEANVHYEYEDDALYLQVLDGVGRFSIPANTLHADHRPSHVTPAYYALWPLWALMGGGWFAAFVLKALLIGSGAGAAFLLAARKGLSPRASLTLGTLWLLWAPTVVLVTSTLRPLTLAAGPLLWMMTAFETRRWRELLVWASVVVLFREDLALTVGLLGGVALLERRPWRWVLVPAIGAGLWLLVTTQLVIPAMVGTDLAEVLTKTNMGETPLWERGIHAENALGIVALLAPLMFLPLGARISLAGLVGVASILINVHPFRANLVHLMTPAVAAAFAGAIVVIARRGAHLLPAVCVAAALVHVQPWIPPTLSSGPRLLDEPGRPGTDAWSPLHPALFEVSERDRQRAAAIAHIPADASVSAVGHLLPLLVPRRLLYGYGHGEVDFLATDFLVLEGACVDTGAGHHVSIPDSQLQEHRSRLEAAGWKAVVADGPVLVLRRTAEPPAGLADALRARTTECEPGDDGGSSP